MLIRCPTCGSECVTTANCPTCTRNRLLQEANDIAKQNSNNNDKFQWSPNDPPISDQVIGALIFTSPIILFILWMLGAFK